MEMLTDVLDRLRAENSALEAALKDERVKREQAEQEIREFLWTAHGHQGVIYGDDGERQCGKCVPVWDYKRAPLMDVVRQAVKAIQAELTAEREARAALIPELKRLADWLDPGVFTNGELKRDVASMIRYRELLLRFLSEATLGESSPVPPADSEDFQIGPAGSCPFCYSEPCECKGESSPVPGEGTPK